MAVDLSALMGAGAGPQAALAAPQPQPGATGGATAPVANSGMAAGALARLKVATNLLSTLIQPLGAGSDAGKAVLKALSALAPFVPEGEMSQGVQDTALQNLLLQAQQQGPQVAAMRAAPGGMGGASAPPQLTALMGGRAA